MAKVKLLVSMSGADGSFDVGAEYPCSAGEAKRMIERGYAEALPAPTRVAEREKAVKPQGETRARVVGALKAGAAKLRGAGKPKA